MKALFLLALFAFIACESKEKKAGREIGEAVTALAESFPQMKAAQQTPFPISQKKDGEEASWPGVGVTVTAKSIGRSQIQPYGKPEPVFLIEVLIDNTKGEGSLEFSATDFSIQDAAGYSYEAKPSQQSEIPQTLGVFKPVPSGNVLRGKIIFSGQINNPSKIILTRQSNVVAIWNIN